MAYEKTVWTNGATALSAEHMNHIEDGIEALDTGKVDKETGKGLSTNDFTDAQKVKVNNLTDVFTSAEFSNTISSSGQAVTASGFSTKNNAKLYIKCTNTSLNWTSTDTLKINVNSLGARDVYYEGHPWRYAEAKEYCKNYNVIALLFDNASNVFHVIDKDTHYNNATTSVPGLMSVADKTKLNGIESGAQVNPTLVAGSNVTLTSEDNSITIAATDTTYNEATTSAAGLMSKSDKQKLNGIEPGAQAIGVQTQNLSISIAANSNIQLIDNTLVLSKQIIGISIKNGASDILDYVKGVVYMKKSNYWQVTTIAQGNGVTHNGNLVVDIYYIN